MNKYIKLITNKDQITLPIWVIYNDLDYVKILIILPNISTTLTILISNYQTNPEYNKVCIN